MRPVKNPQIIDGIESALAHFENVMKLQPTLLLTSSAVSAYLDALHTVPKHDRIRVFPREGLARYGLPALAESPARAAVPPIWGAGQLKNTCGVFLKKRSLFGRAFPSSPFSSPSVVQTRWLALKTYFASTTHFYIGAAGGT